jgi:hypothetical protein
MTVAQLESGMDQKEFREWIDFNNLDPIGEQRADMRMAHLAACILAPHSKRSPRPADHLLFPEKTMDLALVEGVEDQELEWMRALRMNE